MSVAKSCPTLLRFSLDCSPPGSSVHGLSRQQSCSGFPFPSPGDLPDPGIEPGSPALQADSLPLSHQGSPNMLIVLFKKLRRWLWFPFMLGEDLHSYTFSLPPSSANSFFTVLQLWHLEVGGGKEL